MSSNQNSLFGKVALVTGSSSGLGEAIVTLLASKGAKVTVTGRSEENVARVASLCQQLSPYGFKPNTVVGNLVNETVSKQLVSSTVDQFGQLDILVNNAGGSKPATFDSVDKLMESFDYAININTRSVLYLSALAAPFLEKTKGCIVNISSIGAYMTVSNTNLFHFHLE